jgi:hypothetical protein
MLQTSQTARGRILLDGLDGHGDEWAANFLLPAPLAGLVLVVCHNEAIFALFMVILASCGIGQSG